MNVGAIRKILSKNIVYDAIILLLMVLAIFIPLTASLLAVLFIIVSHTLHLKELTNINVFEKPILYLLPVFIFDLESTSISALFIVVLYALLISMTGPFNNVFNNRNLIVFNLQRHNTKADNKLYLRLSGYIYIFVLLLSVFSTTIALFATAIAIIFVVAYLIKTFINRKDIAQQDKQVMNEVVRYGPKFAIFCGFKEPMYYTYTMWDKYFKDVGESFIIITQKIDIAEGFSRVTDVPIVYCGTTDLKIRLIDNTGIKAVFYPVNTASNVTTTQAMGAKHIFIGHGDSDKAPSYRRVTAMYDYQFVAGQEAIDRYENHGIHILKDKFVITGRPQVEEVQVGRGSMETMLYAPTWQGHTNDVDYTSLYKGREIIKSLLEKKLRVVFRPHPQAYTSNTLRAIIADMHSMLAADTAAGGPQHLYGDVAEKDMTTLDCFNVADAMISDVSSVISDFLYSEKPILLIAMKQDTKRFREEYPIARAAYIFEKDLSGFEDQLDKLISGNDDMRARRIDMKKLYLGGTSKSGKYSDIFISAVKKVIN